MKRSREKTSVWWDHFDETNDKNATCTICKAVVSSSSTTNFANHYEKNHKGKYQSVVNAVQEQNQKEKPTRATQTTIDLNGNLSQIPPVSSKLRQEFNNHVAMMIVNDSMPFNTVERIGRNSIN